MVFMASSCPAGLAVLDEPLELVGGALEHGEVGLDGVDARPQLAERAHEGRGAGVEGSPALDALLVGGVEGNALFGVNPPFGFDGLLVSQHHAASAAGTAAPKAATALKRVMGESMPPAWLTPG